MKNLALIFLLCITPWLSHAGGDLPFPLDIFDPMKASEIWLDPQEELKILCQELDLDGKSVIIVRIEDLNGEILDQQVQIRQPDLPFQMFFVWKDETLVFQKTEKGEAHIQFRTSQGTSNRKLKRSQLLLL